MVDERHLESVISAAQPRYPDMVKRDVLVALTQFQDLHPSTEHYVYNDGRQSLVITLNGTVPINYKSNTYNIPICLYLSETHPYNSPMCYVRPTTGMVIKATSCVDSTGRLYLPYLHQWKYPKSDLSGLVAVMIISFNETCPVFAKSSSSSNNLSGPGAYPETAPFSGYGFPTVQQPVPSQSCPAISGGAGFQPYGGVRAPGNVPPQRSWYSAQTPYPTGPYTGFPTPHVPAATGTPPRSTSPPYPTYPATTGTIQPEHIRSSLLSAVQDKIRSKLRESIGTAHAELQCIKKTREDLNAGEQRIKNILEKMQKEETDLQNAVIIYQDAIEDMNKLLALAAESEELSIDDALNTTTPLYRQLLNCYVEDNAIEDCIYYLSQALKNNKLDLDLFLKNVRMLSRQQFYLRAIMIKCRTVAGLNSR